MELARTFRIATQALRRNLLRATLTTLGIVIGIAAVIAMVEIGQGSSLAIQKTISSMGANNIVVLPGAAASGGVSYGAGSSTTLTPEDADAIAAAVPGVKSAAPIVRSRVQIVYGDKNWTPQYIQGTTPSFLEVRDWKNLAEGEMFSEREVRSAAKVCVIGKTLVRELFGGASPIGENVRLMNVNFKVIGVLSSKGANMMGSDQDDILIAPWTSIKYRVSGKSADVPTAGSASSASGSTTATDETYPGSSVSLYPAISSTQAANNPIMRRFENVDQILVGVRTAAEIPGAMEEMTQILRERHRLRADEADDFNLRDMAEMTNALTSTSRLMTRLLLTVACISLVVGGVGIMNIMLVSVTERTREIGLRMAVGARQRDILQQFLVEAVVLCLAGGALGVMLGRGASMLVASLLRWPTAISLPAIFVAVAVALTVGLVFGFYPAWRASKLDPIEALRYE